MAFALTDTLYTKEANLRFSSGFESAPVTNTNAAYVGLGYDLSGAGWQVGSNVNGYRAKNVTMISPLHWAASAHAMPRDGFPFYFVGAGDVLRPVTVTDRTDLGNDRGIGRLTRAFRPADGVSAFRMLDISTGSIAGRTIMPYGTEYVNTTEYGPRVTLNAKVNSVGATSMGWGAKEAGTTVKQESGDSNSPIFLPYTAPDGTKALYLMGTASGQNQLGLWMPALRTDNSTRANAIPTVNNSLLKSDGYAVKFTIYDNPADTAHTAHQWTGAGANTDLATAANWSHGTSPSGLPVLFSGSATPAKTALTLGSALTLRGALFKPDTAANPFTLSGVGTLTLDQTGLRNEAAATQTFHVPITLAASQNWEAAAGDFVFTGPIDTTAGAHVLVVGGAKNTTLSGVVSGSGALAKDDAGTLTLDAVATYSGNTILHNGTLRLGPSGGLPATQLLFIAGDATLDLNGRNQTFSAIEEKYGGAGRVLLGGGTLTVNTTGTADSFAGVSGSGNLVKTGSGILSLDGSSSAHTGGSVTLANGTLSLASADALSPAASLTLQGGTLELAAADFTRALGTGAGQVNIAGDVTFSALGATRTLDFGGASTPLTWGQAHFVAAGSPLRLSSTRSDATLVLANPIDLAGGHRTFYVADGSAPIDARLTGALSNGSILKAGPGALEFAAANTYKGTTQVDGGSLVLGHDQALPSGNLLLKGGLLVVGAGDFSRPLGTGDGQVQLTAGGGFGARGATRSVSLGATVAWASGSFVGDGVPLQLSSPASDATVNFTSSIDLGGPARTIQVHDGSAPVDAIVSGTLSNGALYKTGAGVLELNSANTFTGLVMISGGALRVSHASAVPSQRYQLNGGVLELGAGDFTHPLGGGNNTLNFSATGGFSAAGATRVVNLGNAGATLTWGDPSFLSSQPLLFGSSAATGTVDFRNGLGFGTGTRTIDVFDGPAAVEARLSGVLSGTAGFNKRGPGTLELAAANTHGGTLTVENGVLRLSAAGAWSPSANLHLNGGVLELAHGDLVANTGSAAGQIRLTDNAGFSAFGGTRKVTLNGGAELKWNTSSFFNSGFFGTLRLSSPQSDSTIEITNKIHVNDGFEPSRTIHVADGSADIDARLSGGLANGAGLVGVTKTGPGTLELSGGDNGFRGVFDITEGRVIVSYVTLFQTQRIHIRPGATFEFTASANYSRPTTIDGGTFRYDGTGSFNVTPVFNSGVLTGGGNMSGRSFTIGANRTLSPGRAVGTMPIGGTTFAPGGTLLVEMNDATGAKGGATGWDWLNVTGTLNITATAGAADQRFTLRLAAPSGPVANWDARAARSWIIASASTAISNFAANKFTLDASAFAASNDLLGGSFSISQSGKDLLLVFTPAIDAWRTANFGSANNTGQAADSADPDSDGLVNHLEYAFGTSPLSVDAADTIQTDTVNGEYLRISFLRARADLTYTVQGSSDLTTWETIATNPGTVGENCTVTDTVPINSTSRRFLRLDVTRP